MAIRSTNGIYKRNEKKKGMNMDEMWLARDKDGTLCLYIGEEPPKKEKSVWDAEYYDFIELDGSLFKEVQWSDAEPTKVKIVIDK